MWYVGVYRDGSDIESRYIREVAMSLYTLLLLLEGYRRVYGVGTGGGM